MTDFEVYVSPTYKRELKKLKRKHYPIKLISVCLRAILKNDTKQRMKIKDHPLKGKWKGYNEFHPARISNLNNYDQWLVIYKISHQKLILTLVATGDHEILNKRNTN